MIEVGKVYGLAELSPWKFCTLAVERIDNEANSAFGLLTWGSGEVSENVEFDLSLIREESGNANT